jgi:peptidoglycan/xylan/chitin deacetylase (PgdA/CDA1 family)
MKMRNRPEAKAVFSQSGILKKLRPFSFLLFFLILSFPLSGGVNFSDLDLAEDNRLLFRAASSGKGAARQDALFLARLPNTALQQLTAFPERMDLIENGRTLQIRNVFGALRVPVSGGLPRQISGFPSFTAGSPVLSGRVEEMAVSADGRWILYVEPETSAYGNLVLLDAASGSRIVAASQVERPDRYFPASWSPDSRVFIYARKGSLYYYTVNSSGAPLDERFRLIGEGGINSVYWARGGDFFYLRNFAVYRVRGAELFARALYASFLEIGTVAGKLPFEYNPNFDRFWIAPDARSLLLSKGGRNIFYLPLGFDDYGGSGDASLPYLAVPRACQNIRVLWAPGGIVTIVASVPVRKAGENPVMAWRLGGSERSMEFLPLAVPSGAGANPSLNGELSPDGSRALFWGEEGIVLYDYINWKPLETLSVHRGLSCVWISNDDIVTGDELKIERVRLASGSAVSRRDLICLSSALAFGFEDKDSLGDEESRQDPRILALSAGGWFVTDGRSPWTSAGNPAVRPALQLSSRYRVYLENQNAGPYDNIPMVRNITSVGTASLLPRGENRTGLKELSLCFDLYDDAEGLPEVLEALDRFGVKATFFLGGEFIRRYPGAASDIAAAGHETASLFFAAIDLSDSRYSIDDDFISRGLARNEDEFYRATGRELTLIWHPPYYAASPEISASAARAGYRTVARDVDPLDWVSREDEKRLSLPQYSAADMIDRIVTARKPGSVIPVRLGLLSGGRSDYLFSRINVLLDALVREGYSVVPVSALKDYL